MTQITVINNNILVILNSKYEKLKDNINVESHEFSLIINKDFRYKDYKCKNCGIRLLQDIPNSNLYILEYAEKSCSQIILRQILL